MKSLNGSPWLASLALVLNFLVWHAPAQAQAEINLPPRADGQSPTGVSFKTGGFNINGIVDLSIGGEGNAGLRLIRSYASTNNSSLAAGTSAQGWNFNTTARIYRYPQTFPPDVEPPPPHMVRLDYLVLTGTSTSKFQGGSATTWAHKVGSYLSYGNNGESLVFTKIGDGGISSGSYFTFTDAQGAVYVYPANSSIPSLASVTFPDGTKHTYSSGRVISNRGYALLRESANKYCVINMAVHYVTTATTTCPAGVQSVNYTYGTGSFETGGGNLVGVTNALGQTTTYSYVGFGHLGCIKDPGQSVCRITNVYMACPPPAPNQPANRLLDQVISQTTGTGEYYTYAYTWPVDLCYEYTGYGVSANMVAPGGATTYIETNGAGAVGGVTDPLGRSSGFAYDDGWVDYSDATTLVGVQYPEGNRQGFSRDLRGNVTEKRVKAKTGSGLADIVITANYPSTCTNAKTCNKPNYIIDARGNRTDYTWDPTHGGMLTETGPAAPNGVRPQKRYAYSQHFAWIKNSSGGFVQAATPVWLLASASECMTQTSCAGTADEIKTLYTYGATGVANNLLPTAVTVKAGNNAVSSTITTAYDAAGNIIAVDGPLAGSADTTRTRYDALRRVVGVISPDPDGAASLLHRATRNTFDPSGNLIKAERGTVNGPTDADWAAFNAMEAVEGVYDIMGRKLKETKSAAGTIYALTQYSYDANGRLDCTAVRMNPAQWNSQSNACVPQTTGPHGPDRISKSVYNIAGERTVLKLGYGTSVQADEETSTYTANGNLQTITDGEGNKTTYSFDGHDRLFKTNFPHPSVDGLSSTTDYEQVAFDANGNVTQRRLRDGQLINFSFDALNRMTLKDLPSPETDVTYGSYDLQGHLLSVSQGITITSTWDALGRQKTESGPLGTMSFDYDEAGRRTRTTWPDGFYATQDHYLTNEVRQVNEYGSSALALYLLDNRGNRTGVNRGNGTSTTYVPDAISRLGSMSLDLGGTAHDSTSTFAYNPASQIVNYTRSNDVYAWGGHFNRNDAYAINGLNQITSAGSKTVAHDGRGNTTSVGTDAYSYTAENRMVAGPGGATLQYDPLGRLYQISKAGQTTRFLYDGSDLVAEFNASNSLLRRYVHGPGADEPLLWYEGTGTGDRRYYHHDERGSVVAITNAAASSIAIKTYDDYGVPGGSSTGRFAYTGQTWLPEVGLYYYKARMYSPSLGRFMQTDPIGYKDGINWYAYVRNDPVNRGDASGKDAVLFVDMNAADGMGHTSLFYQDESGDWNQYDQGGRASSGSSSGIGGMLSGSSTKSVVTIRKVNERDVPTDGVRIKTNSKQDELIANSAARSMEKHNSGEVKYNLYSNNCTDAAVDVINTAGAGIEVPNPGLTVRPTAFLSELKEGIAKDPNYIKIDPAEITNEQ